MLWVEDACSPLCLAVLSAPSRAALRAVVGLQRQLLVGSVQLGVSVSYLEGNFHCRKKNYHHRKNGAAANAAHGSAFQLYILLI